MHKRSTVLQNLSTLDISLGKAGQPGHTMPKLPISIFVLSRCET